MIKSIFNSMVIITLFSITFLSASYAQIKTQNPDGTTTLTFEPGERERLLQEAEEKRLRQMQENMFFGKRPPENDGGSVTRMASKCKEVRTPQGVLEVCDLTVGGVAGDSRAYMINGEEFDGRVRENADGTFTVISDEALSEQDLRRGNYSGPTLPPQFNCRNNGSEFQCLVCSCFFEARGQTFPERVRVSRTKFSRVLNQNFANDVCSVVHEVMPAGGFAYSWADPNTQGHFTTATGEVKLPLDVNLGVDSKDLTPQNQKSFRGCVHAANESLQYRNIYFASYYWTKSIEGTQAWMKTCDRNTKDLSDNVISGFDTNAGNRIEYAHNFRKICETSGHRDERALLGINQSPYAPYRPTVRPKLRPKDSLE